MKSINLCSRMLLLAAVIDLLNMEKLHSLVFLLLLHCFMTSQVWSAMDSNTDKSSLLAFKASIAVDPHNLMANWSVSSSPCDWVGVGCNTRHGRVRSLDLSDSSLEGIISLQLGNLSFLKELDLSRNNFHSQIPKELVQLHRLKRLNLSYNDFHGQVPTWIGALSMLEHLGFRNNSLNGFIPLSLFNLSRLEILDWNFNLIEGTIPLELRKLQHLKILRLAGNKLSGIIPQTISNLSSLDLLSLSYNSLSGGIPNEIGGLQQLHTIYFGWNQLSGIIPNEIGHLSRLKILDLENNSLSGSIPSSLFNNSKLQELSLFVNQLYGSLPSNMCFGLPKLEMLYVHRNDLTGDIPSIWHQCKEMKYLAVGDNKFNQGYIPSDIGNLTNLQILYLSNSNLKGEIPQSIFTPSLREVDLSENHLNGNLPEEICYQLPLLEVFNVLDNHLEGNIPKSMGNCTSLLCLLLGLNSFSDIVQRLSIMIDVASALEYLHHGSSTPTVHCDVKPTNVLLDENMVAHLSDFGISKLLSGSQSNIYTKTFATIGYMAPEYGSRGVISMKGDVYSFGILIMEILTRKKPTDDMFGQHLSLKEFVSKLTPHSTNDILDVNLLHVSNKKNGNVLLHVSQVFELALNCCNDAPEARPNMSEVVMSLKKGKAMLMKNIQ